ncbi:protodermal factor 1-like [Prosopis cineraria]|uniref:protodermal factor 1-like n=1 Tax=Prosopis cineraria TaxID=364024 RepID=UPI00240F9CDE|nr:protodermal factor 1-like [Prosopis cineraria]
MEKIRRSSPSASLFIFTLITALISHDLVIPVISSTTTIENQKSFLPPYPHPGSPPSGSGSYGNPPPSDHGSGGGYGSPSPPSHHGGGGSHNPTPSTPSGGRNCGSPPHHDPSPTPSTPSNPPSRGGGGYYNSPPSYGGGSPPATPTDPGTPTTPSSPPYLPSPPSSPFTGTCSYWRNHPAVIWGLLGWWGTLGSAFGVTSSSVPGFSGATMSLPEALSNTRTDGLGALYREGTASFLNSLVNNKFPYTTNQVRDRFVASAGSNNAAAAQAQLFRMANEGRMKPRD